MQHRPNTNKTYPLTENFEILIHKTQSVVFADILLLFPELHFFQHAAKRFQHGFMISPSTGGQPEYLSIPLEFSGLSAYHVAGTNTESITRLLKWLDQNPNSSYCLFMRAVEPVIPNNTYGQESSFASTVGDDADDFKLCIAKDSIHKLVTMITAWRSGQPIDDSKFFADTLSYIDGLTFTYTNIVGKMSTPFYPWVPLIVKHGGYYVSHIKRSQAMNVVTLLNNLFPTTNQLLVTGHAVGICNEFANYVRCHLSSQPQSNNVGPYQPTWCAMPPLGSTPWNNQATSRVDYDRYLSRLKAVRDTKPKEGDTTKISDEAVKVENTLGQVDNTDKHDHAIFFINYDAYAVFTGDDADNSIRSCAVTLSYLTMTAYCQTDAFVKIMTFEEMTVRNKLSRTPVYLYTNRSVDDIIQHSPKENYVAIQIPSSIKSDFKAFIIRCIELNPSVQCTVMYN